MIALRLVIPASPQGGAALRVTRTVRQSPWGGRAEVFRPERRTASVSDGCRDAQREPERVFISNHHHRFHLPQSVDEIALLAVSLPSFISWSCSRVLGAVAPPTFTDVDNTGVPESVAGC